MAIRNFFHNLSQGPPNPGFMQKKVQKGDFLKKDSRELKFFSCFRFLWISRRPGTLNWEQVVFLLSKIIYRKCVLYMGILKNKYPWNQHLKVKGNFFFNPWSLIFHVLINRVLILINLGHGLITTVQFAILHQFMWLNNLYGFETKILRLKTFWWLFTVGF